MSRVLLMVLLSTFSGAVWANEFAAQVNKVQVSLSAHQYILNADLAYNLSPAAKEALEKGIPLTWEVIVNVKKVGFLWDDILTNVHLKYQLKNHALLNLYSVKNLNTQGSEMFSTLTGAIHKMSQIRRLTLVDELDVQFESDIYIAIKVLFSREALPTPLRPFSYFDSQWALSSDWTLWPLQN